MSRVQPQKRSYARWSPEETSVLIKAWAPLYIRGRARSSRCLVTAEWHAVAEAVNSYCTKTSAGLDSIRTVLQCKHRVRTLRRLCLKGLTPRKGWSFFSALHAVWDDEVGDRVAGAMDGRGAPAGDAGGTAAVAAGAYDGAVGNEGGAAAGNAGSGTVVVALAAGAYDGPRRRSCEGPQAPAGYDGAATDEGGSAAAGAYDGAAAGNGGPAAGNADCGMVAVDDFGRSGDECGIAMDDARASAAAEGFFPAGEASCRSEVEVPDGPVAIEGAATAGDAGGGNASVDARGGALVHEGCRAAAVAVNSSRSANGVCFKRAHKQRRRRVKLLSCLYKKKRDAVFDAAVGEERGGGASIDGRGAATEADLCRSTFAPPPILKTLRKAAVKQQAASSANMAVDDGEARVSTPADATLPNLLAEALAAGSAGDAEVIMKLAEEVTKLGGMYKELRMKTLDVEMEKTVKAQQDMRRI